MTSGYNYLPPLTVKPPQPAFVPTTPVPVYVEAEPIRPEDRPVGLEQHERVQALAAAHQVKKRYPGPAGEILANEITAWHHMGFRVDNASPVARLIRELTTSPQEAS